MSATMRLHPYVTAPEGRERLRLLAERNLAHEAWVNARNRARLEIRNARRLKQILADANKKLRGDL